MNAKAGSFLLLGVVASVVSGCGGSGVTSDEYTLVANPPGFEWIAPTIEKEESDTSSYELYLWSTDPDGWPVAELAFTRMKDTFRQRKVYVRSKTLQEQIDSNFSDMEITLGEKGTAKNVLGELDYQYFSLETILDCIFIEQGISRFSDQLSTRSGAEPLGDMVVRGWYCLESSEPDKDATLRQFIHSFGIRGYAVPDT